MSWTDRVPTDALKWVSVAAALAATATAEYNLAVQIGMHEWVAPAVPVALDAYVLRALQRGREVFVSVVAMVGVNAASHLEHAGMIPLDWRLTTAVAAIAPLVLWRVHALKTSTDRARKTSPKRARRTWPWTRTVGDVDTPVDDVDAELVVPPWLVDAQEETRRVVDGMPVPDLPAWDPVYAAESAPEPTVYPPLELVHASPPPLPETWMRRGLRRETDVDDVDGLNLGHVAAGRLHPTDTPYMERARTVYADHGGGRGIVRRMVSDAKVRSDRAGRLVKACEHERGDQ